MTIERGLRIYRRAQRLMCKLLWAIQQSKTDFGGMRIPLLMWRLRYVLASVIPAHDKSDTPLGRPMELRSDLGNTKCAKPIHSAQRKTLAWFVLFAFLPFCFLCSQTPFSLTLSHCSEGLGVAEDCR